MKNLFALVAVGFIGTYTFAASAQLPTPQFPNDSDWAVAMVEKACSVDFPAGVVGTISKVNGGVVYQVFNQNGVRVGAASAKSTSVFAKKVCL